MDYIKEAFQKVKQEMDFLTKEVDMLKSSLIETREKMIELCNVINKLNNKIDLSNRYVPPTNEPKNPTFPSYNPTLRQEIKGLKSENIPISTGNEGVPTDKQTNRQTDISTQIFPSEKTDSLNNALEVLNSLDNLKKELRLRFKRLTEQELLIFSTIYQLEEEQGYTEYKVISQKLNLSESSIRDYVQRLIKKGISIEKKKINNKIVQLSISSSLKKIASLSTILKLRDL